MNWKPIADCPDELKDGREVLLCDDKIGYAIGKWDKGQRTWISGPDHDAFYLDDVTFVCEITAPEDRA